MISDIIANQQNTSNIPNILDIEQLPVLDTIRINETIITGDIIPLTKDTHEKIYNYLLGELKTYKQITNEKEQTIFTLNNKIEELLLQLNDLETKLNKMNNINLLIKLKENLINKQNDFSSEINNINNNSNTNEENIINSDDISMNLSIEDNKSNNVIDDGPSLKPKKKPSVFGRRF